MEAQLAVVVLKGRVKLVRPMDAAAIDDHHDLFVRFAEGRHHLMAILTQLLGIKMRHDLLEDFGGAILDGTNDAEQHASSDAAPRTILQPRLAFERLLAFDVALAQRAGGEARALHFAPPARAGQGEAPEDRFVLIEQNNLATAGSVLQGSQFKRAIGKVGRGGIEPPGGTIVAYILFFQQAGKRLRSIQVPTFQVCE